MNIIFEIIAGIRNMRQELEIPVQKEITVVISTGKKENRDLIDSLSLHIQRLSKLSGLSIEEKYTHLKSSVTTIIKDIHVSILLEGVIDLERERLKIKERIEGIELEINTKKRTLSQKQFLRKAPPEIVEKERERVRELTEILKRLKTIKDDLQ